MPEINKIASFKITPEQFLDACSIAELQELDLLMYSPRYQEKISGVIAIEITNNTNPTENKQIDPA